jgi:hypothetical protein
MNEYWFNRCWLVAGARTLKLASALGARLGTQPVASAALGGMWSRWWRVAGTAAVVSVISVSPLTACSTGPKLPREVITYSNDVPHGITPATAPPTAPGVAWAPAGRIYVDTMGNSSCPNLPAIVDADGPHHLIIKTKQRATGQACTADLGPTTSTIALPTGIDPSLRLRVHVDNCQDTGPTVVRAWPHPSVLA